MKDRRLFEQVDRLTSAYRNVVLVVEGDPVHMHRAAWQAALGRALLAGVGLVHTTGPEDTAAWLARLARLKGRPASAPRGTPRVRRPTDDDAMTAQDVLRCLPGISTVGARRLLEHFGSPEAVFTAGRSELLEVPGIGPKRATLLDRLFRHRAGDGRDDLSRAA